MLDYTNPNLFKTGHDGQHIKTGYAEAQYLKGLNLGRSGYSICFTIDGVWTARNDKENSFITSYEKMGYHACTSELLRGFIESGTTIYAFDENGKKVRIQ